MRGKGHYSLDMYRHRHITSNAEKTKGETNKHHSLISSQIIDKIDKKRNEVDLFGKRPSEIESSIYEIQQRIAKLKEWQDKYFNALNQETEQTAKYFVLIRAFNGILDKLD